MAEPTQQTLEEHKERKRRKREFIIIAILGVVIPVTLYVQHRLIPLPIPGSAQIFFFSLVNLDALLILLLLFLVLRNTVKLIVERRKGLLGSSLRTKIVIAFVSLSFIPMAFLLYTASNFIRLSVQTWFGSQVERTFSQAMEVAQSYYESVVDQTRVSASEAVRDVAALGEIQDEQMRMLHDLLTERLKRYELDHIELRLRDGRSITRVNVDHGGQFLETPEDLIAEAMKGATVHRILPFQEESQEMVKVAVPIESASGGISGVLIASSAVPTNLVRKIREARHDYNEFLSTRMMRVPLNRSQQQPIIAIIGLLSLFAATWIGFHLSGWLTVPIRELSSATERIASGELGFTVNLKRGDEMGVLLESFNRMSADLKRKTDEIEDAHREVRRRAQHTEAILASVASGVMTLDAQGRLLTVNAPLVRMFNVDPQQSVGRSYSQVFPELAQPLAEMILQLMTEQRDLFSRELSFKTPQGVRTYSVVMTRLVRDRGESAGKAETESEIVVAFDDVTDLIRAQKDMAWREVARRIGHEIKNPLTPIQLSAQRLRKKYPQLLGDASGAFDECTKTIVSQVEEMKTLVNVLTDLAHIPPFQPAPCDFRALVEEIVSLYRQAHSEIRFDYSPDGVRELYVDRQQMRRALINLIDNAVTAVQGEGGGVSVQTEIVPGAGRAVIRVMDTGIGVPAGLREKIFEPYFSYGKKGMGLGLPIVKHIVEDHSGVITVEDNTPKGAVFRIELPLEA
ncbi:MAG: HAMP domain-containing protein [Nitrospirae bacterium]|nr:HAMP domain-containing protein [Nitrospirota bacterium]